MQRDYKEEQCQAEGIKDSFKDCVVISKTNTNQNFIARLVGRPYYE